LRGVETMRPQMSEHLTDALRHWAVRWSLAGFEERVRVSFSTRLRTSLGRCVPAHAEIRVASFLLTGPPGLLHEVLCHEAAHVAAVELHGSGIRPHGPEWKALMAAAGFGPRVRIPVGEVDPLLRQVGPAGRLWEHRCPVCQMRRLAGRPVRQWRCAACTHAGLEGRLVISRTAPPGARV
jgi:SprT protein